MYRSRLNGWVCVGLVVSLALGVLFGSATMGEAGKTPCPVIIPNSSKGALSAAATGDTPAPLSPCPGGPTYLSFLGGVDVDGALGVAADAQGNLYVAGSTSSPDFPTTPGAYDASYNGGGDLFVAKFDATLGTLIYSTFLGGSGSDNGAEGLLVVDAAGNVYIAAETASADFPVTPGAYDTTYNGGSGFWGDVIVAKLSPAGDALVYSTFIGGSDQDQARGIAVDGSGTAYVTGMTNSRNFPTTPGAFDRKKTGWYDLFALKLNPQGSALGYSTFLGGSAGSGFNQIEEQAGGIAIDTAGNAYVVGSTSSSNYPTTPGAYDRTFNGGSDAIVTKLNVGGSALVYSTFMGGSGSDVAKAVALDSAGNAHVSGGTYSADFPTTNGAFDRSLNGGSDVFATKFNSAGSALIYSTYIGGSVDDANYAGGVAVDSSGELYLTGWTSSLDFPTTAEAFDTTFNGGTFDAFVVRVAADGTGLVYSSYLGGSSRDWGTDIRLDSSEVVYVVGSTESYDFPASTGAYDLTLDGARDSFVGKMY